MARREKGECESCGFETDLNVYEAMATGGVTREFKHCDICWNTTAGNASRYSGQYPNGDVLKMLAYCTNLILSKLP
jgi:hypothetical protein